MCVSFCSFADAFILFTLLLFTFSPQHGQPHRTIASLSEAVRVRCLASPSRVLINQHSGAGEQTSNLPVISRPALPPELLPIDGQFQILLGEWFSLWLRPQ